MTVTKELLSTFDNLPETEQVEFALEILKRILNRDFPPVTDENLVLNAEELFLALDQQESHNEDS